MDFIKIRKSMTTFEYDQQLTFKICENTTTSKKFYSKFSCDKDIYKVENKVLFLQAADDPISRVDFIPYD